MKLNALEHPKTLAFASRLGVELPTAIGHLELLWAFTAKQSPRGDVGKWEDGAIALACYYKGEPEKFVNSLLKSGLMDAHKTHRLVIHDWQEHCPNWIRAKLKKIGADFISTKAAASVPTEVPTEVLTEVGSCEPPSVPSSRAQILPSHAMPSHASTTAPAAPTVEDVSRETTGDWFLDFKIAYPTRAGDYRWHGARKAANARIAEGHTAEQFIDGARRYAKFCEDTGKLNTEHVKQAATFLGPDKPFMDPWTLPETPASRAAKKRADSERIEWANLAERAERVGFRKRTDRDDLGGYRTLLDRHEAALPRKGAKSAAELLRGQAS